MFDLADLDLDLVADALQDNSYEHTWFIVPMTGAIVFLPEDRDRLSPGGPRSSFSRRTAIVFLPEDGVETDLDDTDLVWIDALPSRVWYRDMADFADEISDDRAGRRLARAIQGRGAFRRFKNQLHDEVPSLLTLWYEFSNRRALRRAVAWLADRSLVDRVAAEGFLAEHREIDLA